MPKKYRVVTDQGTFDVEVDTPLEKANARPLQEPTTYDEGVRKSVGETASQFGTGLVKGLNPMPLLRSIVGSEPGIPAAVENGKLVDKRPKGPGMAAELSSLSDPEKGGEAVSQLATGLALGRLPVKKLTRGAGSVIQDYDITHPVKPVGDFLKYLGKEAPPASTIPPELDRYMPNTSPSHFHVDADSLYHNPAIDFGEKPPVVDRYMPNTSDSPASASPVQTDRIPYGGGDVPPKAMGRRPGIVMSDAEYDALLKRLGGSGTKDAPLTTAELRRLVGSEEAARQTYGSGSAANIEAVKAAAPGPSRIPLDTEGRQLDAGFRDKMDDPLASLLMTAILGGGSAKALMSSHGDQ